MMPVPTHEPPKPHPNALIAMAIGMRNRGQSYVTTLKGPVWVSDWLRQEFEKYGYDLKDMVPL